MFVQQGPIAGPTFHDIHIKAGATYAASWVYGLPGPAPDTIVAVPFPDGSRARMVVREHTDSQEVVLYLEPTCYASEGRVALMLPSDMTGVLTARSYVYQIEVYPPTGEPVLRLASGRISVEPEVVKL